MAILALIVYNYVMKIVHIITRMILGGAQENTLLTCIGQQKRGHEVILITGPTEGPEGELLSICKSKHLQVIEIKQMVRQISPIKDLIAYQKLKQILAELSPDIVHTHSAKAGILGRAAAWQLRVKSLGKTCCHKAAQVNIHRATCSGLPKIVHTIHGLSFHKYLPSWKNYIYITAEKYSAKQCDFILCVAQAMTDQAVAAGIGKPEQYIKVFSGMQVDHYLQAPSAQEIDETRNKLGIGPDHIVIAKVARLFEFKGHDYVIEAAKEIVKINKNVVWLFIGDGNLQEKLKQQIDSEKLTAHFFFTGLVSPYEVAPLIHIVDILIHCSLREGLARVLPQALLCKKPVISFDVDGAREVCINEQTGILIPPKDIKALIAAQLKLIQNPDLRAQFGLTGQNMCKHTFCDNVMVDNIERVYQSL
jgi:glycosyltransferase involved in cell wall biosynthesis